MKCFICEGAARIVEASRGIRASDCSDCGAYLLGEALLAEQVINKLTFNVQKTREWLNEQRRLGMPMPLLAATNVYWNESPWPAVYIGGSYPLD
ncbi:hypothetical protein NPS29_12500 [Pseudomonas putida]|uniref:hypothetical protein n=1 Tax=Pseudomonas putida TaxID=303 RepID=UPI002364907B|nr:hypothetical protein [Pseudomonas putida]MDD1966141.1 hypothetical protein [Pseudomonas putida]